MPERVMSSKQRSGSNRKSDRPPEPWELRLSRLLEVPTERAIRQRIRLNDPMYEDSIEHEIVMAKFRVFQRFRSHEVNVGVVLSYLKVAIDNAVRNAWRAVGRAKRGGGCTEMRQTNDAKPDDQSEQSNERVATCYDSGEAIFKRELLQRALKDLSPPERQLFEWVFIQKNAPESIAVELKVHEKTVLRRIKKLRTKLRADITARLTTIESYVGPLTS